MKHGHRQFGPALSIRPVEPRMLWRWRLSPPCEDVGRAGMFAPASSSRKNSTRYQVCRDAPCLGREAFDADERRLDMQETFPICSDDENLCNPPPNTLTSFRACARHRCSYTRNREGCHDGYLKQHVRHGVSSPASAITQILSSSYHQVRRTTGLPVAGRP